MLNKKAVRKTSVNAEGAPCLEVPSDLGVFMIGSSLKPKNSFYFSASEHIKAFEKFFKDEKDFDYKVAMAYYLSVSLGIRFSPVLMLSMLAEGCQDQSQRDKVAFAASQVFDRPDKIANVYGYREFHKAKHPTSIPSFFKRALRKALEKMQPVTLKKRRMSRRKWSLADLIKLLHPKPKSAALGELYKAIIENRKEAKLEKETITDVLSNKGMKQEEKQEWITKNFPDLPINAMIRNLTNIDDSPTNREALAGKLKNALRVLSGVPQVKVCNPFDVLTAGLGCGKNHFASVVSDALSGFTHEIDYGFAGKKVLVMIDISGSMLADGIDYTAKYMTMLYPALAKSELIVCGFDTSLKNDIEAHHKAVQKYKYDPVSYYNWFRQHFVPCGGTSLVECTQQAINKYNPDVLFVFSDEMTWADYSSGGQDHFSRTILSTFHKPSILVNPRSVGKTAVDGGHSVIRVSSLDAKLLYYIPLIANFKQFKEQVKSEFLDAYRKYTAKPKRVVEKYTIAAKHSY